MLSNDPTRTKLPEGRLTFPSLFKVNDRGFNKANPKFEATIVFDDPKVDLSDFNETILHVCNDHFKKSFKTIAEMVKAGYKYPLKKGTGLNKDGEEKAYLAIQKGKWVIKTTAKFKPVVIGVNKQALDENEIYSGCYVSIAGKCFPYDTAGNRGVTFFMQNVLKTKDGERLATGIGNYEDDFADDFSLTDEDGTSNEVSAEDIPF